VTDGGFAVPAANLFQYHPSFSRSNMQRMRQFYLLYPICAMPSHKLSWSHIIEFLKIDDNLERDNPPICIILSKEKDELLVEYAIYGMNSQFFVSKYQIYLPNKEELKRVIYNQLEIEKESNQVF
jgi:hypothetical protein